MPKCRGKVRNDAFRRISYFPAGKFHQNSSIQSRSQPQLRMMILVYYYCTLNVSLDLPRPPFKGERNGAQNSVSEIQINRRGIVTREGKRAPLFIQFFTVLNFQFRRRNVQFINKLSKKPVYIICLMNNSICDKLEI